MRFYTTEQIGKTREVTPEGYLLCRDVPIARIGMLIYGPGEVPVDPGKDGVIRIQREADEVFHPNAVASFNGKPIVNDHPDDDVTPATWKKLALGIIMDPRRGGPGKEDLLLADLLITDQDGIELINDGKVELSCGYDAQYESLGPGIGRQHQIIGNHVALVEKGRCGPRCSIGDKAYTKGKTMPKSIGARALDRLFKAFKDGDEGEFKAAVDSLKDEAPEMASIGGGENHIHVHLPNATGATPEKKELSSGGAAGGAEVQDEAEIPDYFKKHVESNNARFDKLEEAIKSLGKTGDEKEDKDAGAETTADEEEKKQAEEAMRDEATPGTEEKAVKATDSAYFADSFQETIAYAEILAPGMRFPTFDSKAKPVNTVAQICKMRRKVLDHVYADPQSRHFIESVHGRRTFDCASMSCAAVRTLFRSAAALKRAQNNGGNGGAFRVADSAGNQTHRAPTLAEINERNAQFWSKQNG